MFKGVYTAIVSPFSPAGALDLKAFESLIEWQANAGIHGIVPCGTTGENPTLAFEEWQTLIRLSVEVCRRRGLSVIAGCGSNNTIEVVRLIGEAHKLGAMGALIVTPYYNKPNQRGIIAHYEAIAEKSALPIILYNVPGRTNVPMSVDTVKHLFKNEKIVGIKEASGNHSQWLHIAKEIDLSKKSLLAGDDDAFATLMALGGHGIISATANVIPEKFVEIYSAAVRKDFSMAFRTQKEIFPVIESMFIETNPSPVKCALKAMGKSENLLRLPLVPVSVENEQVILSKLREMKVL